MLHSHLKQGFRLNRSMGFALLGYSVLFLIAWKSPYTPQLKVSTLWESVRFGVGCGFSLIFVLMNELALGTLKRHPRLDELTMEKISVLLPMSCAIVIVVNYLTTGQLGYLLLGMVACLQAQLLGHSHINRIIASLLSVMFLICLTIGYPLLLGPTQTTLPILPFGVKLGLAMLPGLLVLHHFGNIISLSFRSTSSRVNKLESLAATDGLTGLINRRQFNQQLDSETARAKRYRKPLSLALFDIDNFKKVNDFYGHPTGDRILKELATLILQNIRESDIAARYGGEEFALILPETGQIDAYELLERIRAVIERTVFCLPDNPMTVTISVGVAQLDLEREKVKGYEIVENADAALYVAKRQGKNQVVYGTPVAPKLSYPHFPTSG